MCVAGRVGDAGGVESQASARLPLLLVAELGEGLGARALAVACFAAVSLSRRHQSGTMIRPVDLLHHTPQCLVLLLPLAAAAAAVVAGSVTSVRKLGHYTLYVVDVLLVDAVQAIAEQNALLLLARSFAEDARLTRRRRHHCTHTTVAAAAVRNGSYRTSTAAAAAAAVVVGHICQTTPGLLHLVHTGRLAFEATAQAHASHDTGHTAVVTVTLHLKCPISSKLNTQLINRKDICLIEWWSLTCWAPLVSSSCFSSLVTGGGKRLTSSRLTASSLRDDDLCAELACGFSTLAATGLTIMLALLGSFGIERGGRAGGAVGGGGGDGGGGELSSLMMTVGEARVDTLTRSAAIAAAAASTVTAEAETETDAAAGDVLLLLSHGMCGV